MNPDTKRKQQTDVITILAEFIRKDNPGTYLGYTNFDPKREAEKVATFVNTYLEIVKPD
jgi:ribulose bisphosphate carboxylase small subunit